MYAISIKIIWDGHTVLEKKQNNCMCFSLFLGGVGEDAT